MFYSNFLFPIKQRIYWRKVRRNRELWPIVSAGKSEINIAISERATIDLRTADELSQHIFSGAFEWEEREWMQDAIRSGTVFYDIGANIGYFTLLAAEWCGKEGHVYSFEPVESTFMALQQNITKNSHLNNITIFRSALGDRPETRAMHTSVSGKDAWNSFLAHEHGSDSSVQNTEVNTLDDLVEKHKLRAPGFIKIDVEGWERQVIKGAEKTLRRHKPMLLVEFTKTNLEAAGITGEILAQDLRILGYELFTYDARHRKLQPVTSFEFVHRNIIALHE